MPQNRFHAFILVPGRSCGSSKSSSKAACCESLRTYAISWSCCAPFMYGVRCLQRCRKYQQTQIAKQHVPECAPSRAEAFNAGQSRVPCTSALDDKNASGGGGSSSSSNKNKKSKSCQEHQQQQQQTHKQKQHTRQHQHCHTTRTLTRNNKSHKSDGNGDDHHSSFLGNAFLPCPILPKNSPKL